MVLLLYDKKDYGDRHAWYNNSPINASFLPALCRQILHIALAMRLGSLLVRTKKSTPIWRALFYQRFPFVFCRVESWGTLTCGTCWVPSLERENFHEGTPYSRRIYAWQEILLPRRRGDLHDRLWIPSSEYGDIRNSFSTRPILCNSPYIVSLIVQSSSTSEADDAWISPS